MKNVLDLFDLQGRVAVVFGGNGRLGREFCQTFLELGASTYCCDINTEVTPTIQKMQNTYGDRFHLCKTDSTKKSDLSSFSRQVEDSEGRVDVLVNSTTAKSSDFYLPFEEVSEEGWEIGLRGNLTAAFLAIQAFIPLMKRQRSGSIVNIASHYGMVGNDQRIYEGTKLHEVYAKNSPDIQRIYSHGVYNAAKGGLINFTRYIAAYYGEYNIRCNAISPGGVYHEKEDRMFLAHYSSRVPLGRKANISEINGAVAYLASDASSYVTGHNLVVDGGYTAW